MNHSREYPDVELSCGVGDRILHTFTMMLKKANDNRQKLLKLLNACRTQEPFWVGPAEVGQHYMCVWHTVKVTHVTASTQWFLPI